MFLLFFYNENNNFFLMNCNVFVVMKDMKYWNRLSVKKDFVKFIVNIVECLKYNNIW